MYPDLRRGHFGQLCQSDIDVFKDILDDGGVIVDSADMEGKLGNSIKSINGFPCLVSSSRLQHRLDGHRQRSVENLPPA